MKKKSTTIAIIILVVLLIVAAICYFTLSPNVTLGKKIITINVDHLNSADSSIVISTKANTLREALEDRGIIDGIESSYGLWVTTVDGETANDANQEWWGYTVNGEFAQYGVDEQVINDGDLYEFTLNVGY